METQALQTTDDFEAPTPSDDRLQRWLQDQETPLDMIEKREGRGGKEFYYLRHQYVTEQLNKACGHNWDFEILREQVIEDQIMVLGKLTLRVGGETVTKSQYGSSDVKRKKGDNTPVSIGDDFKAAASDALKKCASLIGLGLDLGVPMKEKTRRHLHAVGTELCDEHDADWDEKRHKLVRVLTGKSQSSNDLLDVEARIIIAFIKSHLDGEALSAPVAKEFAAKL